MGGNNQCFRIKVHTNKNAAGQHVFKFEQPTQPGQLTGGYMTKLTGKPESAGFGKLLDMVGDAAEAAPAQAAEKKEDTGDKKLFSMDEIRKHNTEHDCWII